MNTRDSSPRALVLGASGFIGRSLARLLAERRVPATLVVRDRAANPSLISELASYGDVAAQDLGARRDVLRLIADAMPSAIFNLAAYGVRPGETDPYRAELINTQLVGWLTEATELAGARHAPLRLIHAGSAAEYGEKLGDVDERTPERPVSLYGSTKLAGTRLIAEAATRGVPATCARLFMVYGPGEHPGRLLPSLIAAAISGERLELSAGTQRRDFTYVEDAAEALLRLAAIPAPNDPVVNVATGRTMAVRAFVMIAADVFGLRADQLAFGARTGETGMDYGRVDVALMRNLSGWTPPTDVEEGLRRTAAAAGLPPA